jgi:putative peptidoglycan lipid II flippase
MRRLFAEGAFAQAFVPVLSEYRSQGSHEAVKALLDRVAGSLGSILICVTVLAVVGAPLVATVFAPGFMANSAKFDLTTDLIRITFPYLMLVSLTGFAGAILNSYDRFAVPAFTPVLLNVSLISAAIIASSEMAQPVFGLAYGVLAAGMLQLVFQLPFLMRLNLLPSPKVDWQDSGVKRILALMVPALFGVSVSQINLLLDTVLASLLPGNGVSWLYYSDRLSELPLGVFAIAISTVILPNLSRQHAGSQKQQFNQTLDWALRLIVLIGAPASLALMVLAEPILTTLFQYGKFSAHDVAMSTLSLRAYASGLLAFMLIKVLAPGYYARQDMKTPVKIGVIAMVANMFLNVLFVAPLYYFFDIGHVGLALATAVAAYLNAFLLYRGLHQREIYRAEAGWSKWLLKSAFANGSMAGVLLILLSYSTPWMLGEWWQRATYLGAVCAAGLLVYVGALLMSGVRPRDFKVKSNL